MSKAQRARLRWSPVKGGGTRGFANTLGGEWCGVAPERDDVVIDKCRYDAFLGTNLELILDGLGIESVVCVGVATEVCVETTARSAFMRNFNVVVVSDATGTTDDASYEASLAAIRKYFGRVEASAVVLQAWGQTVPERTEPVRARP
jgi:ureidoacrylate peracid hydrolase